MAVKKKKEGALTLSQLISFFNETIEPRFQKIEKKLEEHDNRFNQIDQHLDGLYKKFEDLRQEYVFINAQFKRLELGEDFVQESVFKTAVLDLKKQVASLQSKVEELEKRFLHS